MKSSEFTTGERNLVFIKSMFDQTWMKIKAESQKQRKLVAANKSQAEQEKRIKNVTKNRTPTKDTGIDLTKAGRLERGSKPKL